jgi:hypothetical protein
MIFLIVIKRNHKSGTRRLSELNPSYPLDFSLHTPDSLFFPLFSIIFFCPTVSTLLDSFCVRLVLLLFPLTREPLLPCPQQRTSPTPRAFNNSLTTSCHGCKPHQECNSIPRSDLQTSEPMELDAVSVSIAQILFPKHTRAALEDCPKKLRGP